MATETQQIEVPQISIRQMEITIIGDSPLIQHKWSEKAKAQMLSKQKKEAKQGKEAKNPEQDFKDSVYVIEAKEPFEQSIFGFPAVAFKASAVGACRFVDGVKMTEARGAFHIIGEIVRLYGPPPKMREDMVRIGMGTADIRFRGEFFPWAARLEITYNDRALSAGQIINLFNVAGFGVGVGEWRPERDGSYGRFHVATEQEVQAIA